MKWTKRVAKRHQQQRRHQPRFRQIHNDKEDDPNLSKTLIKYLKINSYEVDWAKNGEEAMDLSYETL